MSKQSSKQSSSEPEKPVSKFTDSAPELSLKKFCSKKSYQVEFAAPRTVGDQDLFAQIVEEGKKYEYLSSVYFITYQDVVNLLERMINEQGADLPKFVEDYVREEILPTLTNIDDSLESLALITKLKIIETMYKTYKQEVNSVQRRQQIRQELAGLLHDCEPKEEKSKTKKKKDRKESSKSSKTSKSNNKKNKRLKAKEPSNLKVVIDDYTDIILEESDVIFDYNIDNHLIYMVLCNFPDPLLLQELAKIEVQVSATIDVASTTSNSVNPDSTTLKLQNMFATPKNAWYLENTAWIKFRNSGNNSPKNILEEFIYVVKKINYIKRQHFCYIRELYLDTLGGPVKKLRVECLEKYARLMNSYPCDLVTVPLIVKSLVDEICWRELGSIRSLSDLTPSSKTVPKEVKSFQAHEEDLLKIGLNVYSEAGRRCYDDTLKYLKFLQPLQKPVAPNEILRQNRAVSTEDECFCDHSKDLFDYFHMAIFNETVSDVFVPKETQECEFTSNLVMHDYVKEYQNVLPFASVEAPKFAKNDTIANYHMKENLSTSVLRQLIFKAMNDYSHWDRHFCTESDCVLLRFHDNLNDFGLNTRIWWQNLRTPVCLRDFCLYVASEEKKWLEQYKLVEHEKLNEEEGGECAGLRDLQVPEVYQEYQYMLEPASGVTSEEKKKTFQESLNEVLDYPKSDVLSECCKGTLRAYDLGPQLCQLTGHTTIFYSDDGVKVTVDTSRFTTEDPKCVITIDSNGNSLVFHQKRPSGFHSIFKDGTIVSFSELPKIIENPVTEDEEKSVDYNHQLEEDRKAIVPNYNDHWIQVLRKHQMASTLPYISTSEVSARKIVLDDNNLDHLLELFKAAVLLKQPIYKFSMKPSLRYLKRVTSPFRLPLITTLKRVLFKPVPKKRKIGNYSVLNLTKIKENVPLKYDFKVTLPNGLALTTLPRNKRLAEIKQEYKFSRYKEHYRILYSSGVILIKNLDGSTTILRSNGDIVTLSDDSKCKNLNCVQKMSEVFREQDTSRYKSSRCENPPKATIRKGFVNLYEFGNIPYTKKTLLEFSGNTIEVAGDHVIEKQQYYLLSEHDYHADEVFYEREDGMKCIIDKNGRQIFQFPDGTKITSWPEFEKELIQLPKTEGWVPVVVSYKFEHPDYLPVMYDQTNNATSIFLNDGIIKNTADSLVMTINENIVVNVTSDNLVFLKTCELCHCDCTCKIHINGVPELLEACDSCGSYFTCDSNGKCKLNRKRKNKQGSCDHRWKNENQKLFILNSRHPPGTLLWKDSIVEKTFLAARTSKNVRIANYMNRLIKKQTLELLSEIYQDFSGRFTTTDLYKHDICLSKYKRSHAIEDPRLSYVTYRILIEIQNLTEREDVEELNLFLESRNTGVDSNLVEAVKHVLTFFLERKGLQDEKLLYRRNMEETTDTHSRTSSESRSISVKMAAQCSAKWREECAHYRHLIRNKIFNPYFQTDYYQNVPSTLK